MKLQATHRISPTGRLSPCHSVIKFCNAVLVTQYTPVLHFKLRKGGVALKAVLNCYSESD